MKEMLLSIKIVPYKKVVTAPIRYIELPTTYAKFHYDREYYYIPETTISGEIGRAHV